MNPNHPKEGQWVVCGLLPGQAVDQIPLAVAPLPSVTPFFRWLSTRSITPMLPWQLPWLLPPLPPLATVPLLGKASIIKPHVHPSPDQEAPSRCMAPSLGAAGSGGSTPRHTSTGHTAQSPSRQPWRPPGSMDLSGQTPWRTAAWAMSVPICCPGTMSAGVWSTGRVAPARGGAAAGGCTCRAHVRRPASTGGRHYRRPRMTAADSSR
mmetsp:Transcript_111215/g.192920  ORF Transcript_111215/g.192920 Transcript_111215/m.192920 type:complete len:208 (-) Transcript_111215:1253-1876(-)